MSEFELNTEDTKAVFEFISLTIFKKYNKKTLVKFYHMFEFDTHIVKYLLSTPNDFVYINRPLDKSIISNSIKCVKYFINNLPVNERIKYIKHINNMFTLDELCKFMYPQKKIKTDINDAKDLLSYIQYSGTNYYKDPDLLNILGDISNAKKFEYLFYIDGIHILIGMMGQSWDKFIEFIERVTLNDVKEMQTIADIINKNYDRNPDNIKISVIVNDNNKPCLVRNY
jgi:hypothetical protein